MWNTFSQETINRIRNTYLVTQSIQETQRICDCNYRTVKKYIKDIDIRNKRPSNDFIIKIYECCGSLNRTSKICGLSTVSCWRILNKNNIPVGKAAKNWKTLYNSLRARCSKSEWRETVLKRDDYKCVKCKKQSKIVHHIVKLSDIRDKVLKENPNIDPRKNINELRQFLNLCMDEHKLSDGQVLCQECHDKIHYPNKVRSCHQGP